MDLRIDTRFNLHDSTLSAHRTTIKIGCRNLSSDGFLKSHLSCLCGILIGLGHLISHLKELLDEFRQSVNFSCFDNSCVLSLCVLFLFSSFVFCSSSFYRINQGRVTFCSLDYRKSEASTLGLKSKIN